MLVLHTVTLQVGVVMLALSQLSRVDSQDESLSIDSDAITNEDSKRAAKQNPKFSYKFDGACDENGVRANLHSDDSGEKFFTVCHNNRTHGTSWVRHVVQPDIDSTRPSCTFREDGFFKDLEADRSYRLKSQQASFDELIGESEFIATDTAYLQRGHLAPSGDFETEEGRCGSFSFANVHPQWNTINGARGNWWRLEIGLRRKIDKVNRPMIVYTGTAGVLKCKDQNNNLVNITIGRNRGELVPSALPVPLWSWKLYHFADEDINSASVVIVKNNPFDSEDHQCFDGSVPSKDCTRAKCNTLESDKFNFSKSKSAGDVFCCEFKNFPKKFPFRAKSAKSF